MEIRELEKSDEGGILRVFLEAVLMPNGELIRYGKSLGVKGTLEKKGIYVEE